MQNEDYRWFRENYDSLFQEYGNTYLLIKDKKVIGTYDTYADGVRSAIEKYEKGSFIVQKCNGSESAYTNYISSMNFN